MKSDYELEFCSMIAKAVTLVKSKLTTDLIDKEKNEFNEYCLRRISNLVTKETSEIEKYEIKLSIKKLSGI